MATGIEGDVARIEAALGTPTLKLLDRKSAVLALPIFAALFPDHAGSSNLTGHGCPAW